MLELFHKGGPIRWPLLILSVVPPPVVLERLVFIAREKARRARGITGPILPPILAILLRG